MSARIIALQAVVLLVTCAHIGTAVAANPDPQAEAIHTFELGQEQFRQGRYDAAAGLFKRAHETWEDPAYLYNIAFSFEKGERWRLAILWYERFLARYGDSPNAPEVKRRRAAAAEGREAARASVFITSQPAGARASALSDADSEDAAPSCVTPCLLKVDPGAVVIRVALGSMKVDRSKSLTTRERWDLEVVLPGRGAAVATIDRTPSWVAWGIGGASLVAGVVLGALANAAFSRGEALVAEAPLDADGQRDLRGERDAVRDLSLYADIGFVGALVGASVGTVLWFTANEPVLEGSPREGAAW